MNRLDQFIDQVSDLPPAPKVLAQLLVELRDPNTNADRIVELIGFDAALTARTLQICNSAEMGSARKVADIHEAVVRLGFRRMLELVAVATGARTLGRPQRAYGIDQGELWRHSVAAAIAAQVIAEDCCDPEAPQVFTGALLHDLGKTVLSQVLEDRYDAVARVLERSEQSWLNAEMEMLGVHHAEIGGRLLQRWEFPENIVAAVWHHHDPAAAGKYRGIASYACLGNMLAHLMGEGFGHHALALRGRREAMEILELRGDCLPRYMIATEERLGHLSRLFNQPGPRHAA